ncbi:osmoprotectant transport system permease protein [Kineosphaera limosa]|uniref:Putative ABC transporter permease protein n=1 Tax=Kineosphaera limosa NBRC 100340 TaxID=1184609 RepID=K6W4L4_9MICO|nr:ABC transporter permease subunit [Kineosphaera limosa]NYE02245.1 osmoprotectant transport system permease protein [Kineosphaera limosa]GAB94100.1 putative ABC transporter permease protein [Kineosphaera limosa NBRC 100340]
MIGGILDWLTDPANTADIVRRLVEHLEYSLLATLLAALIAIPLGLWIGHTGRGAVFAVGIAGAARAIPSLGLLYLFVVWLSPLIGGELAFYIPNMLVLVVLAIPPILSGTYAGIEAVDPAARDAAKGMGMRGPQVLAQVEVPCALPLIFSGLQSALLQVIATATLAATAGMGGLGRFLIDGLAIRDYYQMAGGAVLVALLALAVDLLMSLLKRAVTSPGIGGGFGGRGERPLVSRHRRSTPPAPPTRLRPPHRRRASDDS